MVEHDLAKVGVASSSLVSRSKLRPQAMHSATPPGKRWPVRKLPACQVNLESTGWVAEWSCSGLQLRVRRFDSDPSLHSKYSFPCHVRWCLLLRPCVNAWVVKLVDAVQDAQMPRRTGVRERPQGTAPVRYIPAKNQPPCPGGEIGRRKGLKIPRGKLRTGSIPVPGTNLLLGQNTLQLSGMPVR